MKTKVTILDLIEDNVEVDELDIERGWLRHYPLNSIGDIQQGDYLSANYEVILLRDCYELPMRLHYDYFEEFNSQEHTRLLRDGFIEVHHDHERAVKVYYKDEYIALDPKTKVMIDRIKASEINQLESDLLNKDKTIFLTNQELENNQKKLESVLYKVHNAGFINRLKYLFTKKI